MPIHDPSSHTLPLHFAQPPQKLLCLLVQSTGDDKENNLLGKDRKMNKNNRKTDLPVSVVVPGYNVERTLPRLIASLKELTQKPLEFLFVDDCSTDNTHQIANQFFEVVQTIKNSGPAVARNLGIKEAKGEIIAFTDADCEVAPNWIENIIAHFHENHTPIIMGNVKIPESTFLGDSISALGFPGGGSIGFEKMWHVDENGLTDHITSCNFAAKKVVFEEYGAFDESFPLPGCEDTELSYRLTQSQVPIKFVRNVIVYHEPRTRLSSFIRWHIVRGKGNYYLKKKIGSVGGFVELRIWSSMNIVKTFYKDRKFSLMLPLLFLSFVFQQYGFVVESRRDKK